MIKGKYKLLSIVILLSLSAVSLAIILAKGADGSASQKPDKENLEGMCYLVYVGAPSGRLVEAKLEPMFQDIVECKKRPLQTSLEFDLSTIPTPCHVKSAAGDSVLLDVQDSQMEKSKSDAIEKAYASSCAKTRHN